MKFVFDGKMKFRNLLLLIFAYLRLVFVATKKSSTQSEEDENLEKYRHLAEQKIRFTGNSAQYLKFNVKIPYLMDFAMCIWYKPRVILEHNVLFTYRNQDQQLILWKIKKKQNIPVIMLKISDTIIMEQKIEGLTTGQWHHLCQYWHASIGLWALFLNNYIVSFGYKEMSNDTNWIITTQNATATVNHPRTKKTLYGEIFGFHLMSTDGMFQSFESSFAVNPTSYTIRTANSLKLNKSTLHKRQIQPAEPSNPEVRPPFFRIRSFFRFIRRVVALVTVPVFRFAQRLVMPWRRRIVPLRPTSSTTVSPSATEIITNIRPVTENSTITENSTMKSAISVIKNVTTSDHEFTKLEQSMVIYESEDDSLEPRLNRNTQNKSSSSLTMDSSEIIIQQADEPNSMQSMYEADKCSIMERNFVKLNVSQIENFVTTSTESPTDAITRLGTLLQFMQILYNCCKAERSEVLISWINTRVLVQNVVIEQVAGCGDF